MKVAIICYSLVKLTHSYLREIPLQKHEGRCQKDGRRLLVPPRERLVGFECTKTRSSGVTHEKRQDIET